MAIARIEEHPENGHCPWVVVIERTDGARIWFARETRDEAADAAPRLESAWTEAGF